MKTFLVRIKPRDPHREHVLSKFSFRGIKFEEGQGWYRVSEEVASYLKMVCQKSNDPHSPLAFDVCTESEARAMDDEESKERQPRRPADNARDVVARDEDSSSDVDTKRLRKRPKKAVTEPTDNTPTKAKDEDKPKES